MYIKNIILKNFRNYDNFKVDFINGINIIHGDNGQGKTNLLESIYVLGLTKSHRSFIDNHLIKKGEQLSSIEGTVCKNNIDTKYEIEISKNKILKIDKDIIKKSSDYISNINIIIFYPDDLELIKGSPSNRRRFLNLEIAQLYSNYIVILADYNKILKMRNDYIKKFGVNYDKSYLKILTDYLIEKAIIIYKLRKKFVDKMNDLVGKIFFDISTLDDFYIKYKTSYKFETFETEYLRQTLTKLYEDNIGTDIKYKSTCLGPHKDDLEFYIGKSNIKLYGSQGQQRMAVLALKLAEIEIFRTYRKENPILLLDDVFSELDDIKKNNLLNYIKNDIQTIITTTDLNNISKNIINNSKIIKIKDGKNM